MLSIQPQYITLAQLIQGRLFRIPQYQRMYSWGRKQRQDLFNDIRKVQEQGSDRSHFMATVVGLRRKAEIIGTTEFQFVDIVDGQQRITTLILLLKAIAKATDHQGVREEITDYLVKDDEATLLLLQTNHDSSDFFAEYLRNGNHPPSREATTVADRELLSAMEECERFVEEWLNGSESLVSLVTLLKNRLTFIFHEIADEALVYTVFEVLNSRGLEVSWFDRLKSMLMAVVFEAKTGNQVEIIEEVHQLWTEIYRLVGLRLGMSTESLRFAATLRNPQLISRPLGEEQAALLLHDQSKDGSSQVIQTTRWLKEVTVAVDQLAANHRRNAVTNIGQARMVAVAVYLHSDFTEEERNKVLRSWENVTFRIYGMMGKDARWMVGDYVRLAWRIANGKLTADQVLQSLSEIGKEFSPHQAVQSLYDTDCYRHWGEELRYFLQRYEEYLAKSAGQNFNNEQWSHIWESSVASSVEHVHPQSQSNDDETNPTEVHRLGNLLLLPPGLNSKLQDNPPSEKADAYVKTGLLIAQEVADLITKRGWSPDVIEEREVALLNWALEEWAD